ncbi:MAG: hypothetical protein OSA84_03865, partial [Akkermansiaceae bacterium]|nr:hypothetical protein [Akkermansiaceae bacterium]
MFEGVTKPQARFRWGVLLGTYVVMLGGVVAQAPEDPQFDPSDVYFQAYLDVRAAEQLEKDGDFMAALKKYGQAGKLFESVGRFYPDWKPGMVENRRELTAKAVGVVRGKAGEQIREQRGVIAELEGGAKVGAGAEARGEADLEIGMKPKTVNPDREVNPVEVIPRRPAETLQAQRLKDAEAEAARLRKMIAEADARGNTARRNASRVDDLRKQNELLARQLKVAETNVGVLRNQVAKAQTQARAAQAAKPRAVKPLTKSVMEVDPLQARRLKDAETEMARLRKKIADSDARSNTAMRNASRVGDLKKQNDRLARQLKVAETNVGVLRNQVAKAQTQARAAQAAKPRAVKPLTKSVMEVDPLQARRLKDAETEMARLRKKIADSDARSNTAMRNASRVGDLKKQNDLLARQLKVAETNVQSLRARMAAAPVQSEMKSLNKQIERLEQEREAMGMALKTSRGDHTEALSKIEILSVDMDILKEKAKELRQAEANTKRDLETERKVSNE